MPELPEVEAVRDSLSALEGADIHPLRVSPYPRFSDAASAFGRVVVATRRGKWLSFDIAHPSSGDCELVIHLGMTGRVLLAPSRLDVPHLHAEWQVSVPHPKIGWLGFSDPRRFGRLAFVKKGCYDSLPGLADLGPEATDTSAVTSALEAARPSRRPVKAVMLDQGVIAGAGNIYCDEALFSAGLHPTRPMSSLSDADCRTLAHSLGEALELSLRAGGTTFRDYRRPDGSRGENAANLRCYGRTGEPCVSCGTSLLPAKVAGRATTFCPNCQR